MAITYTWLVKHLNTDQKGYGNTLYMELSGTDNVNTVSEQAISVLGGDDYKPVKQWTEQDIDVFADQFRPALETAIETQLKNKAKLNNGNY